MKKGDIVRVKAEIFTIRREPTQYIDTRNWVDKEEKFSIIHVPEHSHNNFYYIKSLIREELYHTYLGLVLGLTYVATGLYNPGSYDEQGYLKEDKRHVCWKIEPLHQERYLQAVLCLEEDLEVFQTLYFELSNLLKTKSRLEKRALIRTR